MIPGWSSIKKAKMNLTQLQTRSSSQIMKKKINCISHYANSSFSTKLHQIDPWMVLYPNSYSKTTVTQLKTRSPGQILVSNFSIADM